jgi:aminopeptidase S
VSFYWIVAQRSEARTRSAVGRWFGAATLLWALLGSLALGTPQVQPTAAPGTSAAQLRRIVEAIVAGEDSAQRGAAITRQLEALGIPFRRQEFTARGQRGANIVAELPGSGTRRLLLGAHYDRVVVGRGAVDNASGCAAVLELLARLKAEPLRNTTVSAVFFDLEEAGLLGSRAYVEAPGAQGLPTLFFNFDVFGYGDTLWVMSPSNDSAPAKAFQQAAREAQLPLRITREYPPSDHLSFVRAGVETVSVSLLEAGEVDGVLASLPGGSRSEPPAEKPRVLKIIHTPDDTLDRIDSAAMAKALPVLVRTIRGVDEGAPR